MKIHLPALGGLIASPAVLEIIPRLGSRHRSSTLACEGRDEANSKLRAVSR